MDILNSIYEALVSVGSSIVDGISLLVNSLSSALISLKYLTEGSTEVTNLLASYLPFPYAITGCIIGVITLGIALFIIRLVLGGGSNG